MGEFKLSPGLIRFVALLSLCCVTGFAISSEKITIRRADQPRKVDIWTYRDRLAEQHKLEQALRHQRTRQWLWAWPAACMTYRRPHHCGADYYATYAYPPYSNHKGVIYSQVPPEVFKQAPGRLGR